MQYHELVVLKDNSSCTIRHATAADAQAVFDIFVQTHSETDFLSSYADETTMTVADERNYLIGKENSANEVYLCAELAGVVVGTAGLMGIGQNEKVKHRAQFGIAIVKQYWQRGIGRALTNACITCAKRAGYSQLELSVVAANERALELYKSLGFSEYGRNQKGLRSRVSGWQTLVLMHKQLD